jgi:hypothetical protein
MTSILLAFTLATTAFDLPPGLLDAVCYVETKHTENAIHLNDGGSPSLGICQIKLATARELGYKGSAEDLQYNTKVNAHYAAKYLSRNLRKYADINKSISAFNCGHYTPKNIRYVKRVNEAWRPKYAAY